MNGLKEICECGHDKATHFEKEPGHRTACLAIGDCSCKAYALAGSQRRTLPAPRNDGGSIGSRRPHENRDCKCDACKQWLRRRYGY